MSVVLRDSVCVRNLSSDITNMCPISFLATAMNEQYLRVGSGKNYFSNIGRNRVSKLTVPNKSFFR